jgi:murein DD-endopeptidase MepM/ murein hydrolase activator NlpD
MARKRRKGKEIKRRLLHKYRLVILNESTFEEKMSFKLSRLNVFVTGSFFILGLTGITYLLIAFTPLREWIPGYESTQMRRQASDLTYKADSLEQRIAYTNQYLDTIRKVLRGEVAIIDFDPDSLDQKFTAPDLSNIDLKPSREDLDLRRRVEEEDKYSIFQLSDKSKAVALFSPLSGSITSRFDLAKKHYAIDIAAKSKSPVKAVADGTVIFAEWTAETGYVLIVEHNDDFTSVYKHNGSLTKSQGDVVRAGEAIATVGNTGELTTGPHLHFELWKKGQPVNPENFIDFK